MARSTLRGLFGRPAMPLIGDDCLKQVDNLVLPGGHDVELPAHLGEAVVDVCTESDELLPKVNEVLSKSIETRGGGLAEVAYFAAELAHVAVGGPGEHASGGRVLLARLHASL